MTNCIQGFILFKRKFDLKEPQVGDWSSVSPVTESYKFEQIHKLDVLRCRRIVEYDHNASRVYCRSHY